MVSILGCLRQWLLHITSFVKVKKGTTGRNYPPPLPTYSPIVPPLPHLSSLLCCTNSHPHHPLLPPSQAVLTLSTNSTRYSIHYDYPLILFSFLTKLRKRAVKKKTAVKSLNCQLEVSDSGKK